MSLAIEILEEFAEAQKLGARQERWDARIFSLAMLDRARWRRGHHAHMCRPGNREKKAAWMRAYRLKKKQEGEGT